MVHIDSKSACGYRAWLTGIFANNSHCTVSLLASYVIRILVAVMVWLRDVSILVIVFAKSVHGTMIIIEPKYAFSKVFHPYGGDLRYSQTFGIRLVVPYQWLSACI